MRKAFTWIALLGIATAGAGLALHAQETKKGGRSGASYRTLTGKVTEIAAADKLVTVELAGEAAPRSKAKEKEKEKDKEAGGQSWLLSLGRQTLLLRAGKNNQFSALEFADIQKGDSIQAVASLAAEPADRSHTAWWLVVYPAGTTPANR
jgi:hypothetical protein